MSVFRAHHDTEYTVVSNKVLRDKNLSLKSIGLFIKMLSLPLNWDFSIQGLSKICKDGCSAISHCLIELEENGYLKRTKVYKNGKICDIEYDLYEVPLQISERSNKEDFPNYSTEELDCNSGKEVSEENKLEKKIKSDAEFFDKNKSKKDPKVLMKWTAIKINNPEIVACLNDWIKLMVANNKWQTLDMYNNKLDLLFEKKGDLSVVDIVKDTTDKGYFSFTYSIDYLNRNKKKNNYTYQYNTTPNTKVSANKEPVKLSTDEVF